MSGSGNDFVFVDARGDAMMARQVAQPEFVHRVCTPHTGVDPTLFAPKLKIASRLLKKKLGFRMLMDVIPLDASLVKGSHGVVPSDPSDYPLLIAGAGEWAAGSPIHPTQVYGIIKDHVLGAPSNSSQQPT